MALPVIPMPTYPNVPQAAGVPPVRRQPGVSINTVGLIVADAVQIVSLFAGPKWGLFDRSGNPVIVSNSLDIPSGLSAVASALGAGSLVGTPPVVSLEYAQDNAISSAPQEQGAFVSYNKVSHPFRARIGFVQSGTEANRTAFVQSVIAAQASLDLFTLVMPEFTYPNVNVIHHDFRRSQRHGVTMLVIDVWVEQVRVVGTSQFSSTTTKSPSGADPANVGAVQPLPVEQTPGAVPAGGLT